MGVRGGGERREAGSRACVRECVCALGCVERKKLVIPIIFFILIYNGVLYFFSTFALENRNPTYYMARCLTNAEARLEAILDLR